MSGGNGHAVEYVSKDSLTLEGDYADGYKHGVWTAKNHAGDVWYKEQYDHGLFVSGESSYKGQTHTYTKVDEQSDFPGGMDKFYDYLIRNSYYPRDATQDRVEGKVFLSFVIERDGKISNVKVDRKLYPSLDKVALGMLTRSPNWLPGDPFSPKNQPTRF